MALRSALHHAGATALSEMLQFPVPAAEQRQDAFLLLGGEAATFRPRRNLGVDAGSGFRPSDGFARRCTALRIATPGFAPFRGWQNRRGSY